MTDTPKSNLQLDDRKTIFDLDNIIERCFQESEKMGYIGVTPIHNPAPDQASNLYTIDHRQELIKHIALTIVGELYELELVRRIAPIFVENRALSVDFQQFGDNFQYVYDKTVADYRNRGLRIHPEGKEG